MAHLEGTRLGAYEIIERVGSGGMAEVYRAKQRTAFDREVAIKVIRKGYADDEDFRARFLREARAISHLSHLNILPLIEFGESGENGEILFLVMPYVSGGTLRDRIKKQGGPLPLRDTARIFSQLCEALEHAHQHGLIHRDIKPSNVLLQDGKNVLLADFGIALDTGDARLTSTGMGLGTAEYMAPEQAKGQADRRSDVYSMGVVLYVMLTGQAPYSGSTPFDVLLKHATEPLPSLHELNPEVPAPIEGVVQTAMAKAPRDRFQSVQAMLNAFETALLQIGPQALTAMQWSGSVPAVRPPGGTSAPGISTPQSYPPGSGPAVPVSGPSGSAPASGPHSGPSATPISGPVSGAPSGIEDMPTIRRGMTDGSGQAGQVIGSAPGGRITNPELPAVFPGRVTDPELPTVVGGDQATSATKLEATHLPPQPAVAVASQAPLVSGAGAPALPPAYPPMPSAPLPAYTPPPVAVPPAPPPGKKRNTPLIAALSVLALVVIGTSVLVGIRFLVGPTHTPTTSATATSQPGSTTTTRGPITFIANTACTQAASSPTRPSVNPGSYGTPQLIVQGPGIPAFLGVSNTSSSIYYSDQATGDVFVLSPGNNPSTHNFPAITGLSQPGGVAIKLHDPFDLYFTWQQQPGQQTIDDNAVSTPLTSFQEPGNETLPSFGVLTGFALGINPTNDALLVPSPSNGMISCLSTGGNTLTPIVKGLKHPVAAAVDTQGNFFVADDQDNLILAFNQSGTKLWQQPFLHPQDLIVDHDGYVVATVLGDKPGTGSLVRINPQTGASTTLVSTLTMPRGLTLDTTSYHLNDIYFIDQGTRAIYDLPYTPHS